MPYANFDAKKDIFWWEKSQIFPMPLGENCCDVQFPNAPYAHNFRVAPTLKYIKKGATLMDRSKKELSVAFRNSVTFLGILIKIFLRSQILYKRVVTQSHFT